jgi:hypothetical protein
MIHVTFGPLEGVLVYLCRVIQGIKFCSKIKVLGIASKWTCAVGLVVTNSTQLERAQTNVI